MCPEISKDHFPKLGLIPFRISIIQVHEGVNVHTGTHQLTGSFRRHFERITMLLVCKTIYVCSVKKKIFNKKLQLKKNLQTSQVWVKDMPSNRSGKLSNCKISFLL